MLIFLKNNLAVVFDILYGVFTTVGPIGSYLSMRWSVRTLTLIACALTTGGFIISIFLQNIYFLYITFGIFAGLIN